MKINQEKIGQQLSWLEVCWLRETFSPHTPLHMHFGRNLFFRTCAQPGQHDTQLLALSKDSLQTDYTIEGMLLHPILSKLV